MLSDTRLNEIVLENLLPVVFRGEEIRGSRVWNTRLQFNRPGLYLVEARSGGGKSSLVSFLYGSRVDYDGRILFNGVDTATFTPGEWQELRRRHLGWLPQDLVLFPELSALENIRLKNSLTGGYQSDAKIRRWLEKLGMGERLDWPVGKLSVGQMQRVAIVRALCQPFDFLLIDEPVSHLDEANNRIAARIITEEAAAQQAAVIATSVGNPLLLEYGDRIAL